MSEALGNLREAYQILHRNVIRTLHTQRGADTQLTVQVNEALQFFAAAQLHQAAFPPEDFATLDRSITDMIDSLNDTRHLSSDPPTTSNIVLTTRTSQGGRPRVDIDPAFLSQALALRGPTHLQEVFNVSARTIRRRALEYGLVEPGAPVYTNTEQADGSTSRTYASTSAAVSTITDIFIFHPPDVPTVWAANARRTAQSRRLSRSTQSHCCLLSPYHDSLLH
ncbi:hypothetical protein B0H17DRAFT_1223315 [Mycena rosella]|uniref:Uncharacterized protein n=1 Tax=Mycena rosella TaxID=1033263 RepID=A0AAD7MC99_MYCRO|nr:hypothetical protein B0H17DRAFT_1223315 [Mycena rosella]